MGSTLKEKLFASAKKRSVVVEVDGEKFVVQEVSALDFAEYGKLLKDSKPQATAFLLSKCLLDEDGTTPLLTQEEALGVIESARVSMTFVNAIMEVSGFGEKESDAS
jgi:hypothetical protein